ncbi:hypothetical protein ABZ848_37290 [Streptomyces sp. NPDC047081]|uniref:MmyB family transcriptional regulator n=1 Tax=Streptomyces sp. NPDC047081 TaxID=3154706 RepID=UPI0033D550DF
MATNQLARALYEEALDTAEQPPNLARFVFLDPRARRFYRDWDGITHDAVGSPRAEAARTPGNTDLADLVDELAVGDLDLDYDARDIPADPALTIVTYTLAPTAPHAPAFLRLQQHSSEEA